jgi:clan AA aspartic protease
VGSFHVSIEVGDVQGQRFEALEALVDTGATYTLIPRTVLQRLGVVPKERWPFTLADGRTVDYDVAQVQVRLDGRRRYTTAVFGDDGAKCLLGVVTLEEFRLGVDHVNRRLIPVPGLLMTLRRGVWLADCTRPSLSCR